MRKQRRKLPQSSELQAAFVNMVLSKWFPGGSNMAYDSSKLLSPAFIMR